MPSVSLPACGVGRQERGRHSANVAGSGTQTRDSRFEDYSLCIWLCAFAPAPSAPRPSSCFLSSAARPPTEVRLFLFNPERPLK
ncbi:hypothetical protein CHARACLAT_014112 [Characodon lateralis]|uniref:Uncharacterized protein n=1 Tax=Characodon lateralis TaxID=208331 RepID=A0ABU7ETL0_9TELE|nr:hypothetical protein [Characodon lateralis]